MCTKHFLVLDGLTLATEPFPDAETLKSLLLDRSAMSAGSQMYILIAKTPGATFRLHGTTQPGEPAGFASYIESSPTHLATEIGNFIVLPKWQRTFVSSHAIGLLLQNAFTPASEGGLGLRRVVWSAHAANAKSRQAAERMGFTYEGTQRWHRVLPMGRISNDRSFVHGANPGRDSLLLSMTWEDWFVDGKKELVQKLIDRKSAS